MQHPPSFSGHSGDSYALADRGPPEQVFVGPNAKDPHHVDYSWQDHAFVDTGYGSGYAPQNETFHTEWNHQARPSPDPTITFVTVSPKSPYRSLWIMYAFYLAGLAFAIGHHYYYISRDRTPATNQSLTLRYGTLLAFLSKANLVWAIGLALKQRSWSTLRQKGLTLQGVDSLFAVTDDLTALLSWEMLRNAKVAVLLATFVWIGPIAVILASQALSVEPTVDMSECRGVTTLNFSMEAAEDWRNPTTVNNFYARGMSFWNVTGLQGADKNGGAFDYWTESSQASQRVSQLSFVSGGVFPRKDAGKVACGEGWDCNYVVDFEAPGYKCETVMEGVGSTLTEFGGEQVPFNTGSLLPQGSYSYYTHATRGEYAQPQYHDMSVGGILQGLGDSPIPTDLGAFRTEPVIWMGYSKISDELASDSLLPSNRSESGWDQAFIPEIMACKMHKTHYEVKFDYYQGLQRTTILQRKHGELAIDTTWTPKVADDGTEDNTTAIPVDNYVRPQDLPNYRETAAYYSMGHLFRNFLNGTVDSTYPRTPVAYTDATESKLLDPRRSWMPVDNLQDQVSSMFEDFLLSLFAFPELVVVTWAGKPDTWNGGLDTAPSEFGLHPCTKSKLELRFTYKAWELWLVYGISLILSGISVAIGSLSALQNGGVLKNTKYSTVHTLLRHCGIRFPELG